MPARLTMTDGQTVDVNCSVPEAKKRKELGGWQSFITVEGNPCKVNASKIETVAKA